jgi:hypothetical protein
MLQVFKNLNITAGPARLQLFIDTLSSRLPARWERDLTHESEVNRNAVAAEHRYAFGWSGRDGVPPAYLFLWQGAGEHAMRVTNIVPKEAGGLTITQYNSILDDFVERCVRPVASSVVVAIDETSEHVPLTHWVTEDAAKKFQAFLSLANRSGLNPNDKERWRFFVIQVHKENSQLSPVILWRWLTEVEKWPEDGADNLASEFGFARELLDDYDNWR